MTTTHNIENLINEYKAQVDYSLAAHELFDEAECTKTELVPEQKIRCIGAKRKYNYIPACTRRRFEGTTFEPHVDAKLTYTEEEYPRYYRHTDVELSASWVDDEGNVLRPFTDDELYDLQHEIDRLIMGD